MDPRSYLPESRLRRPIVRATDLARDAHFCRDVEASWLRAPQPRAREKTPQPEEKSKSIPEKVDLILEVVKYVLIVIYLVYNTR